MMRLGGNFSIMLMVQSELNSKGLHDLVMPVAESMDLHLHVDHIEGGLHQHLDPDATLDGDNSNAAAF